MIVFGDLHLNRPYNDYKLKLNSKRFNSLQEAYAVGLLRYIIETVNRYDKLNPDIIFLGDITHYNQDNFDYFIDIIDEIKLIKPYSNIIVVLGNHDSSGSYNLEKAKINKLDGYKGLQIINKPSIVNNMLLLPYIKQELIPVLINESNNIDLVLSHNNIYDSDEYGGKSMINYNKLKPVRLINGHIHRYFLKPGYYQIGSAAPTSFKEYMYAAGGCIVNDRLDVNCFINKYMLFMSVNDVDYLFDAEDILHKADFYDSIVFLNTQFKKLYDYKCIVGIVNEDK